MDARTENRGLPSRHLTGGYGGVPAGVVPRTRTPPDNGLPNGDCLTVSGRTIAENHAQVQCAPDQEVVRSGRPNVLTDGVVGLRGKLAAEGAIAKMAGMVSILFSGPASRFGSEQGFRIAVSDRTNSKFLPAKREPQVGGLWNPPKTGAVTHTRGPAEMVSYADL